MANQNIIYVYTRTTKKPRMTKNMLEIARINREAREHGVTYGVYVAGTYHIDTFNRSRHMELVNKYMNAVKLS